VSYLLLNCLTCILTFGDQISVVYHSISSSVCIVVGSGIFWSFQTRVVKVMEGRRNLCRILGINQFTPPTQATGKSQPNRDPRKVSEHAGTRLNVLTASLLIIADDLVGDV
jgi:hypothetical protein